MGSPQKRLQYKYDSRGNRRLLVDPNGGRFTYAYDSSDRIASVLSPQGERTSYSSVSQRDVARLSVNLPPSSRGAQCPVREAAGPLSLRLQFMLNNNFKYWHICAPSGAVPPRAVLVALLLLLVALSACRPPAAEPSSLAEDRRIVRQILSAVNCYLDSHQGVMPQVVRQALSDPMCSAECEQLKACTEYASRSSFELVQHVASKRTIVLRAVSEGGGHVFIGLRDGTVQENSAGKPGMLLSRESFLFSEPLMLALWEETHPPDSQLESRWSTKDLGAFLAGQRCLDGSIMYKYEYDSLGKLLKCIVTVGKAEFFEDVTLDDRGGVKFVVRSPSSWKEIWERQFDHE